MRPQDDLAREHHYVFAHRMLPDMVNFPGSFTELVAEGKFGMTLRGLWDQFGASLPEQDRISSDGIDATGVDVGGVPGMLITLPPAKHWTEMYAALVVPLDPIDERRFFTLERQLNDGSGEPGTMICERRENSHGNFGPGPEGADYDGFIARIARVLSESAGTDS